MANSIQSDAYTTLHLTSMKKLKKYLYSPDKTERYTIVKKNFLYKGGTLISSSYNCLSSKALQAFERGIIVSEPLKELLKERFVRILNSGKIKIIKKSGYCGGATKLFINEYFLEMRKNGKVDLFSISKKFRHGVPLKGALRQIFSELDQEDVYGSCLTIKAMLLENGKRKNEADDIEKIRAIGALKDGIYYLSLRGEEDIGHAIALIKEKNRAYIFDVNHGLIKFQDSENSRHEDKIFHYLKKTSIKLFSVKNKDLECVFTFYLNMDPLQTKEIRNRLKGQNSLLTEEETQISPNITMKEVVPLTNFKKYKMYAGKYSEVLVLLGVFSLLAEGAMAVPYVSLPRWTLIPWGGLFSSFNSFNNMQLLPDDNGIVTGNEISDQSGQEIWHSFLPGIALSLAAEITLLSPPSFLAKVGVTMATMATSCAAGAIADKFDLMTKASKGLNYTKKKITSVAKKAFSVIKKASTRTQEAFTSAASSARSVMSATANFFRSFCYFH